MRQIQSPFAYFTDANGDSLDAGKIYIGTVGANAESSPIAVYWDEAGTQPAAQPLRTSQGYIVNGVTKARAYIGADDYSMIVKDRNGQVIASESSVDTVETIRADLASPAVGKGSKLIAFIQRMTGAVARWVEDKLSESVSVQDFGAVGDGVTDDYAAFVAAHNALPIGGGTIILPATLTNNYRLSQTFNIRKPVVLRGAMPTTYKGQGTSLVFDAGVSGIIVNGENTLGYTTITPDPEFIGGQGSVIENLLIWSEGGPTGPGTAVDGLVFRARATRRNVTCRGFKRNGFRIYADIGGGTDLEGDANQWRSDNCKAILNGSHGFYTARADSNRGLSTKDFAQLNGGYGFYDDSLLGNTYVGGDTVSNTAGAVWSNNPTARNEWIGFWEDGSSPSVISLPSIVIGGDGIGDDTNGFQIRGGSGGGEMRSAPLGYRNNRGAVKTWAQLGERSDQTNMVALAFNSDDEEPTYYNAQFKLQYLGAQAWWSLRHQSAYDLILFPNSIAAPRQRAPLFHGGMFFGPPPSKSGTQTGMQYEGRANAAPTSGTYNAGDYIRNSAPAVGQPKGWVRTVSGTEGTLSGVTGSITNGQALLTVSALGTITRGCWVSVAGAVTKAEVLAINGLVLTLSVNASATVAGAAVGYVAGTWVSEGNL